MCLQDAPAGQRSALTWAAAGGSSWLGGRHRRSAGACGSRGCPWGGGQRGAGEAWAKQGPTRRQRPAAGLPPHKSTTVVPPCNKEMLHSCNWSGLSGPATHRKKATPFLLSHGTYCGQRGSRKLGLRQVREGEGAALHRSRQRTLQGSHPGAAGAARLATARPAALSCRRAPRQAVQACWHVRGQHACMPASPRRSSSASSGVTPLQGQGTLRAPSPLNPQPPCTHMRTS